MYTYQYTLLAGFTCLLFFKNTRLAAAAFLLGWAAYMAFLLDAPSTYKYAGCATLEGAIAYAVNARHRAVAYVGYSLIVVNMFGLTLVRLQLPPAAYDGIYAAFSIVQFLFLLIKAAPNGCSTLHKQLAMVRAITFNSRSTCVIMCKNKQAEGKNK